MERNIVPSFVHVSDFLRFHNSCFDSGVGRRVDNIGLARILEEHKNPKKMRRFSSFSTSPTSIQGLGEEWTILVAALQRLLKKPAADTNFAQT